MSLARGSDCFRQLALFFGLPPKLLGAEPRFFGQLPRVLSGALVGFGGLGSHLRRFVVTCHGHLSGPGSSTSDRLRGALVGSHPTRTSADAPEFSREKEITRRGWRIPSIARIIRLTKPLGVVFLLPTHGSRITAGR